MSFTLRIEFTGLCLYLKQKNSNYLGILMPDCRLGKATEHPDKKEERIVPHVGYLRFDLANLVGSFPAGNIEHGPKYEVVYRFNRDELTFDLSETEKPMEGTLEVPRFEEIANEPASRDASSPVPLLEPLPNLFSMDPTRIPHNLLMRTVLQGGTVVPTRRKELWKFSQVLRHGDGSVYKRYFRNCVTWEYPVDKEAVTITISDLDRQKAPVSIPLKPVSKDGVVPIKIANLCADNPLEWEDLDLHRVTDNDVDFKWLYHLLRPTKGRSYEELLDAGDGTLHCLPVPEQGVGGGSGREDCFGGAQEVATFD